MKVYKVSATCEVEVRNRDPKQIYPAVNGTGWEPDSVKYFNGKPYPQKWRVPTLAFDKPRLPKPDFFCYDIKLLLCNRRAVELLGDLLSGAGELLPVKLGTAADGGPFQLVSVTRLLPKALDRAETLYDQTLRGSIEVPAFRPGGIPRGAGLFKIPQNFGIVTYCVERTGQPGPGEFKALVEHHGLKGLEFKLVWTDEPGVTVPAREKAEANAKAYAEGMRQLAAAKAAAAEAAASKPEAGGSDRPPKPGERKDIEKSVARGYAALGLKPGTPVPATQRAMRKLIDEVVDGKRALTSRATADLAVNLGCLWGQTVCDAAGWQWCVAKVNGSSRALPAVAAPDRSHLVRPMHFVHVQLHKRLPGDNASLLLFKMITGNSLPQGKSNAYITIG